MIGTMQRKRPRIPWSEISRYYKVERDPDHRQRVMECDYEEEEGGWN